MPLCMRRDTAPRQGQTQQLEQTSEPAAIGEGMAHLLGVEREISLLLGRPSLAERVWARRVRGGR